MCFRLIVVAVINYSDCNDLKFQIFGKKVKSAALFFCDIEK
jgi:hypothetical protein